MLSDAVLFNRHLRLCLADRRRTAAREERATSAINPAGPVPAIPGRSQF